MIVLPPNLVATKFPGYYWDVLEKKLYSIKVSGTLTEMKFQKGRHLMINGYYKYIPDGYRVSFKGKTHRYTMEYLRSLKPKGMLYIEEIK